MIWKIIWLIVSMFVIFVSGWSMSILFKQKKAWKEFAKKHKMRHLAGKIFESPEIKGVVNGHKFHFFSVRQGGDDQKKKKYRTVIEVRVEKVVGPKAVFATGDLMSVAEYINLDKRPDVNYSGWNTEVYYSTSDEKVFAEYLNQDRAKIINDFSKIKNVDILFLYDGSSLIFQIHTPQPLDNIELIEKYVKRLSAAADVLMLSGSEIKKKNKEPDDNNDDTESE